MPIIHLRLGANPDAALAQRAAAAVQRHTVEILRKDPGLIAIAVAFIDPAAWFIAGRSLADWQRRSYALEIKITDETNTRDEKARFIAATHAALAELLAPLHTESYIHVHDVRAEAYGYGGRTQAARYHAPG